MASRRPLTLHVSALSDAEYSSYTNSLEELLSPTTRNIDWENVKLSVREARGWIRGRYGASVDGTVIDQILKRFSSELGPHDILTGGQFFAVLRLVCHAQSGSTVDDSLVFVQANPEPVKYTPQRSLSTKSARPPPPRHPSETAPSFATLPTLPPRSAPPIPSPNPFTRSLSTPGPKRPRHDPQLTSDHPDPEKHTSDSPHSSNPFRTQPPPPSPPKPTNAPPSMSSASSSSSSPSNPRQYAYVHATPPLPPRKPAATALLPPPRHASLTTPPAQKSRHVTPGIPIPSSKSYSISSPGLPPPPKPPKPPQATSPLIKQSLQAAKGAQNAKEFMEGLSRERRLEVIKKSGGGGSGQGGGSSSEASVAGSRGGERSVSPPHSFYDVAAARIGRTASPSMYTTSSDASSLQEGDTAKAKVGPQHAHRLTHTVTPNKPTSQFPFAQVVTLSTPTLPTPASEGSPSRSPSTARFPTFSPNASPTYEAFAPNAESVLTPLGSTRRSRSLHHPSPASTASASSPSSSPSHSPPVPPRRRRPESVQVTSGLGLGGPSGDANGDGKGAGRLMRRSSASVSSPMAFAAGGVGNGSRSGGGNGQSAGAESSVLDTLHRTFAGLRPGAGFESARVKAEGRMWPGGYVKGLAKGRGGEGEGGRLVDGEGEGEEVGEEYGQDEGWEDDEKVGKGGLAGMERDELKMPVKPGEGWAALA